MPQLQKKKWLVALFFGAYLLIGLLIFDDYGISWDEHLERNHGLVSLDYINQKFNNFLGEERFSPQHELSSYKDRDHGHTFSILTFLLERALGLEDPRAYFLMRHLCTFLLFWVSTIFFYRIARQHFRDWRLALLLCSFLILSPRIFAHSFYNAKDSIFLAIFIFSSYTLVQFLRNMNWQTALAHALTTALLISMRVLGVLIPVLTVFFVVLAWTDAKERKGYVYRHLAPLGFYTVLGCSFTIAVWPFLWEAPLKNFLFVFESLSNYNWGGYVLYYNHFLKATELPWHYTLGWIFVTTPVVYTLLFVTGLILLLYKLIERVVRHRTLYTGDRERFGLVFLSLFLVPLLAVMALKSTLYDGWRQMYFIYPAFLLLAGEGLEFLANKLKVGKPLVWKVFQLIIGLNVLYVGIDMVRTHPFQNSYFSIVAGGSLDKRFEQDYWGLANRQALEYLLHADSSSVIHLHASNWAGIANKDILTPEQRSRLRYSAYDESDYLISNHRYQENYQHFKERRPPFDSPLYEVKVHGNVLAGVYKLKRKAKE